MGAVLRLVSMNAVWYRVRFVLLISLVGSTILTKLRSQNHPDHTGRKRRPRGPETLR